MITFSMLGNHGRLGNQMFQYALLRAISSKNNFVFAIPKQNHHLFECFDLKCKVYDLEKYSNIIRKMRVYRENDFNYNSEVFTCGDNINYIGNFQTEKYFSFLRKEILEDFSFKQEILDAAKQIKKKVRKEKQLVSIHVRRGDYVNLQEYHPVCSVEYYENSLEYVKDCDIICFSDDIEWCKKNLNHLSPNISYSYSNNPYVDLCLMSMCEHNIIANSSFSWWSAWLNKNENKIIVAPKKWFGPKYNYHNTKDLIPQEWKLV